jgi:hypothetical protein
VKVKVVAGLLIGLMVIGTVSLAVENKGAKELEMPGGVRGNVPFPHHRHQDVLGNCDVCHILFPQVRGSIEKLKAEGKLNPKQVMNTQCTKCHRERRKAGKNSGPISCSACHLK